MSNQVLQAPLFDWLSDRSMGVLMHPTSLPGREGCGTLSPAAVNPWLEYLAAAGVHYWQVCPLGPTGYGDSPYQCFSAFAGNPYLIDLEALRGFGLLTTEDIAPLHALPETHVDFGWIYVTKWPVLFRAFENFKKLPSPKWTYGSFEAFRETHKEWLAPFGLFQALKHFHHPKPWWEWPEEIRFLSRARKAKLPAAVKAAAEAHEFFQFIFFAQWSQMRAKAKSLGIEIIGDAPIFVARDSADVWANPELFQLDQSTGLPLFVAGVPPDYFSADGQLWGNPLYAWDKHAENGFAWWIQRLKANFLVCDVLRIDHFRGFDTYWSIPATAKTAKTGSWEQGPGLSFFQAVKNAMPSARLIAEDLGELMPSVITLREATGLPGMSILQFAFGGDATNSYLPHNHTANSVVYPGTHDNDTTLGWYRTSDEKSRDHVRRYLRVSGQEIGWDFIRSSYASVSNLSVIPIQDLMGLDSAARFNTPGTPAGNWQWRYRPEMLAKLHATTASYLHDLGALYGRVV